MPFGDRTGPAGLGPMTGRRAGYCAGFQSPGTMNPYPAGGGRGYGRGWFGRGCGWYGRGRGWRNYDSLSGQSGVMGFGYGRIPVEQKYTQRDEMKDLKSQADYLKQQLNDIEDRIQVLERSRKQE